MPTLLFVSPASWKAISMAAEKDQAVSRSETPARADVHRYGLHAEQWQGARVDELPWVTRGGLAVKAVSPLTGIHE